MPEAGLDKVEVGRAGVLILLLDHLAGDSDEQDDGVGRPQGRVGNKKPTQKKHLKNLTKIFFLGFFKFLFFFENKTNFSL
jgi:hypothetical protein